MCDREMITYFVHGHRDITEEEFDMYYGSKIRKLNALNPGSRFLVCDLPGCGRMTQRFLRKIGVDPTKVLLFHRESNPPVNEYKYPTRSCKTNADMFDLMLKIRDKEITWVREGGIDSQTERIIARGKMSSRGPTR